MAIDNRDIDPELLKKIYNFRPEDPLGISISMEEHRAEATARAEEIYPGVSKWSLGYGDLLVDIIDHTGATSKDNYPFHRINAKYSIKEDSPISCTYEILMSVAGFTKNDISVEVLNNTLYVDGRAPKDPEKYVVEQSPDDYTALYITESLQYNAIAARNFHRSFLLLPNMEVVSAFLENGTLTITVVEPNTRSEKIVVEVKETTAGTPILYIDKSEPNRSHPGAEIVYVYCDECMQYHTHGMPNGDDGTYIPEHRSPHCTNKNSKYFKRGYMIAYKKIVGA